MKVQQEEFLQWLKCSSQGHALLAAEMSMVKSLLEPIQSQQALFLGSQEQQSLLQDLPMKDKFWIAGAVTPLEGYYTAQGQLTNLPIRPASMDFAILPHTLEFTHKPHHLLREVEVVMKPQGHILILGFNPVSAWGVRKFFSGKHSYLGKLCSLKKIEDWLTLLNFDVVQKSYSQHLSILADELPDKITKSLNKVGDFLGNNFSGLSGLYAILAKKNIHCLTPQKMKWEKEDEIMVDEVGGLSAATRNIHD
jgi:hypothetical protein